MICPPNHAHLKRWAQEYSWQWLSQGGNEGPFCLSLHAQQWIHWNYCGSMTLTFTPVFITGRGRAHAQRLFHTVWESKPEWSAQTPSRGGGLQKMNMKCKGNFLLARWVTWYSWRMLGDQEVLLAHSDNNPVREREGMTFCRSSFYKEKHCNWVYIFSKRLFICSLKEKVQPAFSWKKGAFARISTIKFLSWAKNDLRVDIHLIRHWLVAWVGLLRAKVISIKCQEEYKL